jgi:hypothetical protein
VTMWLALWNSNLEDRGRRLSGQGPRREKSRYVHDFVSDRSVDEVELVSERVACGTRFSFWVWEAIAEAHPRQSLGGTRQL